MHFVRRCVSAITQTLRPARAILPYARAASPPTPTPETGRQAGLEGTGPKRVRASGRSKRGGKKKGPRLALDTSLVMRRDIDALWERLGDAPRIPTDGTAPVDFLQEVEVRISTLSSTGEGLGLFQVEEDAEVEEGKDVRGWIVVVPHVLAGEWVRARIFRNHQGYSYADLVEVLVPSKERQEAPCRYFGQCGGCQLQHMTYERQLEFKKASVEAAFATHSAILTEAVVEKVWASPLRLNYRTKLTPHFEKPKGSTVVPEIGFLQAGRRRVLDVEECIIATPVLNEGLTEERARVAANIGKFKRGATLLLRENHKIIPATDDAPEHEVIVAAKDHNEIVMERVGEYKFEFPAGSFFQNNASILPDLTGYVRDHVQGGGVKNLVDAYCGSGLFSITCASAFERVIGVEISLDSVTYAKRNAALNNLEKCSFLVGDAGTIFKGIGVKGSDSALIIDPPRKGASEDFLDQMIAFGPARIAYVSCNVVTQARDLAYLRTKCAELCVPGWRIEHLVGFDLFPWTAHVEGVALLVREE